jgi:hypothetical protein
MALLDALLVMHLDNPHLMLAAEDPSRGTTLYQNPDYQWAHELLGQFLSDAGADADNTLLAHVLLGAIRAGLVNELTANEHVPREQLRADLSDIVATLVPPASEGIARRVQASIAAGRPPAKSQQV